MPPPCALIATPFASFQISPEKNIISGITGNFEDSFRPTRPGDCQSAFRGKNSFVAGLWDAVVVFRNGAARNRIVSFGEIARAEPVLDGSRIEEGGHGLFNT